MKKYKITLLVAAFLVFSCEYPEQEEALKKEIDEKIKIFTGEKKLNPTDTLFANKGGIIESQAIIKKFNLEDYTCKYAIGGIDKDHKDYEEGVWPLRAWTLVDGEGPYSETIYDGVKYYGQKPITDWNLFEERPIPFQFKFRRKGRSTYYMLFYKTKKFKERFEKKKQKEIAFWVVWK